MIENRAEFVRFEGWFAVAFGSLLVSFVEVGTIGKTSFDALCNAPPHGFRAALTRAPHEFAVVVPEVIVHRFWMAA